MPRRVAIEALTAVDARDAFSNIALDQALKRAKLGEPDARLAAELVYGVLKHRRWLDEVLNRHLKKPLAKLDPFGRAVLRVGAYQLLYLDRVPAHAALSETVEVAKERGAWRGGLTNAVLRRVAESADVLRLEAEIAPVDAASLGCRYGLPDVLAEGLIARLGLAEACAYGEAIQAPAPVTLRVRPAASVEAVRAALEALGAQVEPGRVAPRALRVRGGGSPGQWAALRDGEAVVQDEGSQLVGLLATPQPGQRVLDLCAGRGGKTLHLADLLGDDGLVVAHDHLPAKLRVLSKTAFDLGLETRVRVEADRARVETLGPYDLVLVDAPCTGAGNLRRHPELRWKWSAERLARLEATQRELLDQAVALLRHGGLLVYSVCSDWPSEGHEQIEALVDRHPGLAWEALPAGWPAAERAGEGAAESVVSPDGDLLVQPHRHDANGFFGARLRRA